MQGRGSLKRDENEMRRLLEFLCEGNVKLGRAVEFK
jgi:hypothetical protein